MALTKRWVTSAGAGAHDGTTLADAFSISEFVTEVNTNGHAAGYKYLFSGAFSMGTTSITLTGDGTTTSPLVLEGANATEGDLYANGWSAGGALNAANFPAFTFTGTTARFDASGANYTTIRGLDITSGASNPTLQLGTGGEARQCKVTNTGTNSASSAILMGAVDSGVINCDCETAASGGTYAVRCSGSNWTITGNRVKCPAGTGILVRSYGTADKNTVFECTTGIASDHISATPKFKGNTIVNCTGDGIDILTATTGAQEIFDNHITGCGGYGIDFNTSTCMKRMGNNRFRDNASGDINGGGDWEEGTSQANVTSDDADADDFTAAGSDDYSLKATAPAVGKGIGYLGDIGAIRPPAVAGSSGGLLQPNLRGNLQ